jgi:hypothetical protein
MGQNGISTKYARNSLNSINNATGHRPQTAVFGNKTNAKFQKSLSINPAHNNMKAH